MVKSNSNCLLARLYLNLFYLKNTANAETARFTEASIVVIKRQKKVSNHNSYIA